MAPLTARIQRDLPVVELGPPFGLRYHAATPQSRLSRLADGPPYWAYLWPGGAALIAHLAVDPALVQGRRVLDLGAGAGLVGIAAARAGAQVVASDSDPVARAVLPLNAALNGVAVAVLGDLLAGPPPQVDLILVGDLFYDADLAARVLAFLDRAAAAGIAALVGDIGRATFPRDRFDTLASYPVREVGASAQAAPLSGAVMRLR